MEAGEVMALEDVPTPEPGPGEVRIRVSSITLNFNDLDAIYGRYQTIPLVPPFTRAWRYWGGSTCAARTRRRGWPAGRGRSRRRAQRYAEAVIARRR